MSITVKWNKGLAVKARKQAIAGLRDGAEHILEDANRTIPHDEGVMQNSGAVDVDEAAGEATVYYDTPYVVVQHEDLTIRHAEGRRAKWLEATLNERGDAVANYIAEELRAALGG